MKKLLALMLAIALVLGLSANISASPLISALSEHGYVGQTVDEHHQVFPDFFSDDNLEINWFDESDIIFIPLDDGIDVNLFSDFYEHQIEINWFDESDFIFIPSELHFDALYEPIEPHNLQCILFGCNPVRDGRQNFIRTGGPDLTFCQWGNITEGGICSRCNRFVGTFIVGQWNVPHTWTFTGGLQRCG